MKVKKGFLILIICLCLAGVLIAGCTTPTTTPVATTTKPTEVATPAKVTPVATAAITKPLAINPIVASQEVQCAESEINPPWTSTLLSYEHHDSTRSKCYSCAQFTGSLTGPNTVNVYKSPDNFYSGSMIVTGRANEMFIYGGAAGATPMPSGAYISKVEPGTLKEIWRTPLVDLKATGAWSGAGSIESINGEVFVITNTQLFKVNGTTGAIEGTLNLPTGGSASKDAYFNGLAGWPDGTLIMKNLARAPGCTVQGFKAIETCPNLSSTPPSAIVVVDSKEFKVLDSTNAEQMIGGRITATQFNGKNYAYLVGSTGLLYRYVWDGKHITLDKSWGPVPYLLPGQVGASAAGIMGDWVILMTNGAPCNLSLNIVAINQADASKITRIEPMPLKPGQTSYIPSMPSIDKENNRIYAMDAGPGKIAAIDFDQKTGNMSVAWTADQATLSWMTLINPQNQRVLVASNDVSNEPNPALWDIGPEGANYKEQLIWRDAATGKQLAAGEFYGPQVLGMEVWPGYGGFIYEILSDGSLLQYQVLPNSTGSK